MISQALYGSLSDRAEAGAVYVLAGFDLEKPSTKAAQAFVDAMNFESSVLVVVEPSDEVLAKSLRNLPNVEVAFPSNLSAYLVLVNDAIVFTEGSLPRGSADSSISVAHRSMGGDPPSFGEGAAEEPSDETEGKLS
jgi:large subunit ribosomal protein L4